MLTDSLTALRRVLRSPAFSIVVSVSLALGIGLSVALIEFATTTAREPVVGLRADARLVSLFVTHAQLPGRFAEFDFLDYEDLRATHGSPELAGYAPVEFFLGLASSSYLKRVVAAAVTQEYFDVLGVEAEIGSLLLSSDPSVEPGIVISHALWWELFGGRLDVVGLKTTANGTPFTIQGVMKRGFRGVDRLKDMEAWIPLDSYVVAAHPTSLLRDDPKPRVFVVGKLVGEQQLNDVRRWLELTTQALWQPFPYKQFLGATAYPLQEIAFGVEESGRISREVETLALGATLVLLVACLNLSVVVLARGRRRSQEIDLRFWLGGSRWAAIRPSVLEAIWLTIAGAVGAALAGRAIVIGLGGFWFRDFSATTPEVSLRFLVVLLLVVIVTALLTTLFPLLALRPREEMVRKLRSDAIWGEAMATAQLAVVVPLLLIGALLLRDVSRSAQVDLGYETSDVITAQLDLSALGYDPASSYRLLTSIEDSLGQRPASPTMAFAVGALPLQGPNIGLTVYPADLADTATEATLTRIALVSDFFPTVMGWRLVRGRWFGDADRPEAQLAAVVNEAFTRQFPVASRILGSELHVSGSDLKLVVVGVVRDVRLRGPNTSPEPLVLLSARQYSRYPLAPLLTSPGVVFRGGTAHDDLLNHARRALAEFEPRETMHDVRLLDDLVRQQLVPQLQRGIAMVVLSSISLLLGVIGIATVMSDLVASRAAELSVRIAVGATPGSLQRLAVHRAAVIVVLGVALGLALYFLMRQLLASRLVDLPGTDAATTVLVCIAIAVATSVAAIPVAIRSSRMDAAQLLRESQAVRRP